MSNEKFTLLIAAISFIGGLFFGYHFPKNESENDNLEG
jgi:hypothetical protein